MKIKTLILLIFCALGCTNLFAQNPAQQLAFRQALKMKDTLNLPQNVRQHIYHANIDINNRKQSALQQYANNPALRQERMQFYENQRDSIYKAILNNQQKYMLYKAKKNNILNARN